MTSSRIRPGFLFIGPDKTGSSWLYEVFAQHPDCFVPEIKDIYFFDRYYDRGLDWYFDFFARAPQGARAVGELSHDYLFSEQAARRICGDLPGVKLLTCLRNPVERTHSHYLYLVRSGLTRSSFEEALEEFPELINNSLYAKHLSVYYELFDRDHIKVLFFDRLKADAKAFAGEVFSFLDVPPVDELDYGRRVLPASRPRSHWLARLAKQGANTARDLGLARLVGMVKRSSVQNVLYRTYSGAEKPVLGEETRARLSEVFAPDIRQLETLLGVSLEQWKT
ncbi:MAG: sulfotransferase domain-containing protein, partial [Thiogranum sp.]